MRLLIYTQAVDKNDQLLGFFHRWVEEFAKHFEHIYVVCLKEGAHVLPENVTVYSLGKESGESRLKYVVRFYKHLLSLHGKYDRVFAHMNPHYVILGGLYWKVVGVPVFFWRNHARMNVMTRIAAYFAKEIFYTSPFACTSRYPHAYQMPVGIDHQRFSPKEKSLSDKHKILFLGRLSPVKRVQFFIEAGRHLGSEYELHIYGDAPKKDQEYGTTLRAGAPQNVFFHPGVKNDDTPTIYREHDVYVNLTPKGSMDKTVLEAVACGVPVVVTNESFLDTVTALSLVENPTPELLAERIKVMANLSETERTELTLCAREKVAEKHSLEQLGIMLHKHMV
jgi:glycosyltransferase involved in cell wall biosynthesis